MWNSPPVVAGAGASAQPSGSATAGAHRGNQGPGGVGGSSVAEVEAAALAHDMANVIVALVEKDARFPVTPAEVSNHVASWCVR